MHSLSVWGRNLATGKRKSTVDAATDAAAVQKDASAVVRLSETKSGQTVRLLPAKADVGVQDGFSPLLYLFYVGLSDEVGVSKRAVALDLRIHRVTAFRYRKFLRVMFGVRIESRKLCKRDLLAPNAKQFSVDYVADWGCIDKQRFMNHFMETFDGVPVAAFSDEVLGRSTASSEEA